MTETIQRNSCREAVIELTEQGYQVFPVQPNGKAPLTRHGCKDATGDIGTITAWWDRRPNANWAISTDGLLVVDVDAADSDFLRYGWLESAPCQRTPGGGYHFIFAGPPGGTRCSVKKVAPDIDIRADGGYIVIAPSHIDGKSYEWVPSRELCDKDKLPACPKELLDAIEAADKKTSPHTAQTAPEDADEDIPAGQRNHVLTQYAGYLRRGGFSLADMEVALLSMNQRRCKPPLDSDEVRKIAASVARYEPEPGVKASLDDLAGALLDCDDIETPQQSEPADPGEFPAHLLEVPGFIGEVSRYMVETAYRSLPALSLGAALCEQAVLVGQKVRDPADTRGNLLLLATAPSGGGKEWPRQVNKQILYLTALADDFLGPEGIASHAGLITAVRTHPTTLMQVDEIGRLLQTTKAGGAGKPYLHGIVTNIMKLHTSSASVFRPDAYADPKRCGTDQVIDGPFLVLFGTSTPDGFFDGLGSDSIKDGLLGRSILIHTEKRGERNKGCRTQDIPGHILETVQFWKDYTPPDGGNLSGLPGGNRAGYIVPTDDDAEAVYDELGDDAEARLDVVAPPYDTLWSRVLENARKLGLLYACSCDPGNLRITAEAAQWGTEFAKYNAQLLHYHTANNVSSTEFESQCNEAWKMVAKATNGLQRSVLNRQLRRKYKLRDAEAIINGLQDSGRIELCETKQNTGRPKMRFFAV